MKRGQSLVEYILLIFFFAFIGLGLSTLYRTTLKKYYQSLTAIRTGWAGMGP